jgi:flagellar hook-associated protein 3 FlgL
MRVTEKTRIDMPRSRIAELRSRSSKYNEQIVSGRRVNRPSDDPLGALRIGMLETQKHKVEQFDRNMERGRAFLYQADTALGESLNVLNRIKELTIQSINASLTQQDANDIAAEVTVLRTQLLTLSNSRVGDTHLFGGFQTTQPAYTAAGVFQGDVNQLTLEVGDQQYAAITVQGGAAFGDGTAATQDVFTILTNLTAQIQVRNVAGFANIEAELVNLELVTEQVVESRAQVGIQMSQFEAAFTVNEFMQERVPAYLAEIQDTDIAEAIGELQLTSNALEATLSATGKVLNGPSLLDYLR